jgi:hypothetical protein
VGRPTGVATHLRFVTLEAGFQGVDEHIAAIPGSRTWPTPAPDALPAGSAPGHALVTNTTDSTTAGYR